MLRVRRQTDWAWKVAIYLGLSSAGAGAYVAWQGLRALDATWGGSGRPGAGLGIGLVVVGALFILLDLGRWSRFYLAAFRPGTSWESRGFLIVSTFGLLGLLQAGGWTLVPGGLDILLSIPVTLLALAILPYASLLLRSLRPFTFWSHPLQAALSPVSGLLAGCGILAFDPLQWISAAQERTLVAGITALAVIEALLLAALLWEVRRSGPAGLASVQTLVSGETSLEFWLGAVGLGVVLPLAIGAGALMGAVDSDLVRLVGAAALVGAIFLRHVLLAAAHRPTELTFRGLGPWGIGGLSPLQDPDGASSGAGGGGRADRVSGL